MAFSENAEDRIVRCVRDYERTPRGNFPPAPPRSVGLPVFIGRTTTAVSARSGSLLGSGTVQRYLFNGKDISKAVGKPLTVFNDSQSASWPANVVVKWIIVDGYPIFLTSDCASG